MGEAPGVSRLPENLVAARVATPGFVWLSLTHRPRFYRAMVTVPHAQQEAKAKRF